MQEWHDINSPGFLFRADSKKENSRTEEVDTAILAGNQKKVEVKLSDPQWAPGENGYAFNKEARVSVSVEFLKETMRKKISFDLFVESDAGKEDLRHQVQVTEQNGRAEAELTLYYGDMYYDLLLKDPSASCRYIFKASHPTGESIIESAPLQMPPSEVNKASFVELPDINFHLESAMPILDGEGGLISALECALHYSQTNSDSELVIFGHTDTSGDDDFNINLSELRARAVKAILDNDASTWKKLAAEKGKVEDYQSIFKALCSQGWDCDPGAIDNVNGSQTKKATTAFQEHYNSCYKKNIGIDGIVGADTWEAIFHVLRGLVVDRYKALRGDQPLPKLSYGLGGAGVFGCGESCLVEAADKNNYVSQANRRIELVFWSKNNPVDMTKADPKKKTPDAVPAYDKKKVEKKPIPVKPSPAKSKIKLLCPVAAKHKQYVNLAQNDKDQGIDLLVKIGMEDGIDGQTVIWTAIADGAKRSKRNDPISGLKDPSSGKIAPLKDNKSQVFGKVAKGESAVTLCCGYTGGEVISVEANVSGQKVSFEVETWRKLWYQLTYHKDAEIPSMKTPQTRLKNVFIEFSADTACKHEKGTAGKVIVGNHNHGDFHKMLASSHSNQCVNVIFCDQQFDGLAGGKNITVKKTKQFKKVEGSIEAGENGGSPKRIFNPPLQSGAKFLISGNWINPSKKKKGTLTDDAAKTDDNTGLVKYSNDSWVKIILPKNAAVGNNAPVDVTVELTAASGPWGGDGGTAPHNLIVIDKNDTIHSQCIMHELGHLMNMVPIKDGYACPPGLAYADHTHAYTKMGGSGSHCSYNVNKAKSTATQYVDGKCIMFHQLNRNCTLEFCPECSQMVKAQALRKLGAS